MHLKLVNLATIGFAVSGLAVPLFGDHSVVRDPLCTQMRKTLIAP